MTPAQQTIQNVLKRFEQKEAQKDAIAQELASITLVNDQDKEKLERAIAFISNL